MSDEMRFQTTAIIWVALAAIMIFTPADKIALAFILGIAAAVSTLAIWDSSRRSEGKSSQEESTIKHKRDNRVRRLIEVMDDEEIADMEEYLEARRDDRLSQ